MSGHGLRTRSTLTGVSCDQISCGEKGWMEWGFLFMSILGCVSMYHFFAFDQCILHFCLDFIYKYDLFLEAYRYTPGKASSDHETSTCSTSQVRFRKSTVRGIPGWTRLHFPIASLSYNSICLPTLLCNTLFPILRGTESESACLFCMLDMFGQ